MAQIRKHDDLTLEYLETTPGGDAASAELPLVIGLHGRGSNAHDLASIAGVLDLRHHYRFIFPDAPKPFEPYPGMIYGFTWFDGWPAERRSMVRSREALLELTGQLLERYPTPEGRLALLGFSQGGLMAIDVGFRLERRVAAIVSMSGAIYEEDPPDFRRKPDQSVMIVHGTADDVIPVRAARRARLLFQEHGIEPVYEEFDMGHHVTEESMEAVGKFLAEELG